MCPHTPVGVTAEGVTAWEVVKRKKAGPRGKQKENMHGEGGDGCKSTLLKLHGRASEAAAATMDGCRLLSCRL